MLCAIWYYLYNLNNLENIDVGVIAGFRLTRNSEMGDRYCEKEKLGPFVDVTLFEDFILKIAMDGRCKYQNKSIYI